MHASKMELRASRSQPMSSYEASLVRGGGWQPTLVLPDGRVFVGLAEVTRGLMLLAAGFLGL